MKKCLLLLFASVAMLSACKKEDKKDNNDLKGTVWVWQDYGDMERITFTTSSKFSSYYVDDEGDADTETGTYVYNPPRITLTFDDGFVYSGTVNGKQMTLDGDIYYKQ